MKESTDYSAATNALQLNLTAVFDQCNANLEPTRRKVASLGLLRVTNCPIKALATQVVSDLDNV